MHATAKVFTTGNSQAVRLPRAFRLDAAEVWITRNEATGELVLKPKPAPDDLAAFLQELRAQPQGTAPFIPPRDDAPAADPLAGWAGVEA